MVVSRVVSGAAPRMLSAFYVAALAMYAWSVCFLYCLSVACESASAQLSCFVCVDSAVQHAPISCRTTVALHHDGM
jgi:hypothetical protein